MWHMSYTPRPCPLSYIDIIPFYANTLKMEAKDSLKTLITICQTIKHHIVEDMKETSN
jgi:hypothetical protein